MSQLFVHNPKCILLGKKADSMIYFKQRQLFLRSLFIFAPDSIDNHVKNIQMIDIPVIKEGLTLRFSEKNKLHLPRFFVSSLEELIERLKKSYQPNWTVIIHPYIDVYRSFELNIDQNNIFLEHIPGMWESDNSLLSDKFLISEKKTKFQIYRNERYAKLATTGRRWTEIQSKPISKKRAQSWCTKISLLSSIFYEDFKNELPLNIHFIEDKQGFWSFINMRNGFTINEEFLKINKTKKPYYVAQTFEDLYTNDFKLPLIYGIVSERDKSYELIKAIKWIKKHTNTVYVSFGLLSHPAILMREFGLNVLPSRSILTDTRILYDEYSIKT